jgi:hypothetical protein
VLDPKTSQNLSIFLSQFRNIPHADIIKAAMNLDEKVLTPQQVNTFFALFPQSEAIEAVKQHVAEIPADKDRLGNAEKFVLEVDKAPGLKERLKAFKYKLEFEPKKIEIKPDIDALKKGTKQVKESKRLAKVLEIILHIGNFLNAGTPNGGAYGFKLATLTKLGDTKTTDNKGTLLDYLVFALDQQQKDLLLLREELPDIEQAARVNMPALQGELGKLTGEFNNIKKSVESIQATGPGDAFHEKMKAFIAQAEEDLKKMNEDFKEAEAEYNELVKFFGEDPKAMGPDEFFKFFTTFVEAVEASKKALDTARQKAENEMRRAAAKKGGAAAKEGAPKKMALPGLAKGPKGIPGQDAVVDELFGQMKAGNIFRNRRQAGDQPQPVVPLSPKEIPSSATSSTPSQPAEEPPKPPAQ